MLPTGGAYERPVSVNPVKLTVVPLVVLTSSRNNNTLGVLNANAACPDGLHDTLIVPRPGTAADLVLLTPSTAIATTF